jgi:hypothetical protein
MSIVYTQGSGYGRGRQGRFAPRTRARVVPIPKTPNRLAQNKLIAYLNSLSDIDKTTSLSVATDMIDLPQLRFMNMPILGQVLLFIEQYSAKLSPFVDENGNLELSVLDEAGEPLQLSSVINQDALRGNVRALLPRAAKKTARLDDIIAWRIYAELLRYITVVLQFRRGTSAAQ